MERALGKMLHIKVIVAAATAAVAMLLLASAWPAPAEAATCRSLGVYTDYYKGKPAIYIWNGSVRPVPSKMTLFYYGPRGWETVASPSDWGVRTNAPQLENRRGWYVYFIATRWVVTHTAPYSNWNDDWRWKVRYCS